MKPSVAELSRYSFLWSLFHAPLDPLELSTLFGRRPTVFAASLFLWNTVTGTVVTPFLYLFFHGCHVASQQTQTISCHSDPLFYFINAPYCVVLSLNASLCFSEINSSDGEVCTGLPNLPHAWLSFSWKLFCPQTVIGDQVSPALDLVSLSGKQPWRGRFWLRSRG